MKDDTISRRGVLKLLSTMLPEEAMTKAMLIQSVKQMDAAQPSGPDNLVKDSQGLVKDLVNDCISRKSAIDALEKIDCSDGVGISSLKCDAVDDAITAIKVLPSVKPERKCGKWIEDDDGWDGVIWRCSECDALFTLVDGTPEENEYYFCPHCGADMREVDDE